MADIEEKEVKVPKVREVKTLDKVRSNSKTIIHGNHDFRWESDRYFSISGYDGCDLCGKYDKTYSLVDQEGRIVTEIDSIHREELRYFIYGTYLFCGDCSDKAGIRAIKRDCWQYSVTDDIKNASEWPEASEKGKKMIHLLEKEIKRQQRRREAEEKREKLRAEQSKLEYYYEDGDERPDDILTDYEGISSSEGEEDGEESE
jgi:hypothetical protein